LVQERIKVISEVPNLIDFFFKAPQGFKDILVAKGSTPEKTKKALEKALEYLAKEDDFGRDSLEHLLRAVAKKYDLNAGEVLWPIRVALTGKEASPGAFEVLEALGKEESLKRIRTALDMLK